MLHIELDRLGVGGVSACRGRPRREIIGVDLLLVLYLLKLLRLLRCCRGVFFGLGLLDQATRVIVGGGVQFLGLAYLPLQIGDRLRLIDRSHAAAALIDRGEGLGGLGPADGIARRRLRHIAPGGGHGAPLLLGKLRRHRRIHPGQQLGQFILKQLIRRARRRPGRRQHRVVGGVFGDVGGAGRRRGAGSPQRLGDLRLQPGGQLRVDLALIERDPGRRRVVGHPRDLPLERRQRFAQRGGRGRVGQRRDLILERQLLGGLPLALDAAGFGGAQLPLDRLSVGVRAVLGRIGGPAQAASERVGGVGRGLQRLGKIECRLKAL